MNKTTLMIIAAAILGVGFVYGMSQHDRHADPAHAHEEADAGNFHDAEVSEHGSGTMDCPMMHGDAAASMEKMHEHMAKMREHMEMMHSHMAAMKKACGMEGRHTEEEAGHVDEETPADAEEEHSHDH